MSVADKADILARIGRWGDAQIGRSERSVGIDVQNNVGDPVKHDFPTSDSPALDTKSDPTNWNRFYSVGYPRAPSVELGWIETTIKTTL